MKKDIFGGRYVPETLIPLLEDLEYNFKEIKKSKKFKKILNKYLSDYAGRPTPLYFAQNLSKRLNVNIYLKREDLLHTGAHKINNALGQVLLAKKMKKTRIIAETGAGQHGVATATVSALFNLKCRVYMGKEDIKRQAVNVYRMKLLKSEVIEVDSGCGTLKDAMNEAIRDWVTNVRETYYLIGSVAGPSPYPEIVKYFQSIIGRETRSQFKKLNGKYPDAIIACCGGGSNAMGIFTEFLNTDTKLYAIEAAGLGINTNKHAATLKKGRIGVLHGSKSKVLCDKAGQILPPHSISAGLDYPGVGPEVAYLHSINRIKIGSATDKQAVEAFHLLTELEGIIPALESSHAIAFVIKNKNLFKGKNIIINLSGRGDKDISSVAEFDNIKL